MEVNATVAALLGLLRERPLSGYELALVAADLLGDFWTVTRSQVYRELTVMADRGLVAAQEPGARDRRRYALTDEGRAAFRAFLHAEPDGDTVRIPLLLRLAFVDDLDPERLAELLGLQRARHAATLDRYRRLEAELVAAGTPSERLATLRFGLRYETAVLAWFDEDVPRP